MQRKNPHRRSASPITDELIVSSLRDPLLLDLLIQAMMLYITSKADATTNGRVIGGDEVAAQIASGWRKVELRGKVTLALYQSGRDSKGVDLLRERNAPYRPRTAAELRSYLRLKTTCTIADLWWKRNHQLPNRSHSSRPGRNATPETPRSAQDDWGSDAPPDPRWQRQHLILELLAASRERDPSDLAADHETAASLHDALLNADPDAQLTLKLSYYLGTSDGRAGATLGVSRYAYRTRRVHALQQASHLPGIARL